MRKGRQMFFGVLLGVLGIIAAAATANAQAPQRFDVSSLARPADVNETATVWAAVNSSGGSGYSKQGIIDDLPYPQAPGVVLVTGLPNGSQETKVEYLFSGPISGYVTARMVVGEESIPLQTFFFDRPIDFTLGSMTLHNGFLLQGRVRFDVFNVDGGRVSKLSRFVSFGCCSVGPQIGTISAQQKTVFVGGSFANPAVGIGFSLVKASPTPSGFTVELPYELQEGDWTLTVCDKGLCATRVFNYAPSANIGKGDAGGGALE